MQNHKFAKLFGSLKKGQHLFEYQNIKILSLFTHLDDFFRLKKQK